LQNARTHTPTGTPIRVETEARNGHVELAVTDQGPGFPPQALGSVFDRFYRADVSRSRKSGGSGLGLAIVEAIARAHGGSAQAENVPGAGARVRVRIPVLG
jgi:signal transduction histidine kinase